MIFKSTDEFSYLKDSDKIIQKIEEMNSCLQKLGFETEIDSRGIILEDNKLRFDLSVSYKF